MDERRAEDAITSTPDRDAHRLRNGVIWTAALLLVLLGIGLAVPDLRGVLERVADAGPGWVALAIALEVASCLGYVATVRLVLSRGPAREVRWLAWAEMAFGAVVPVGGAGGLAVGAWAMRAWGIEWSRIVNRSAVIFRRAVSEGLPLSRARAAEASRGGSGVPAGSPAHNGAAPAHDGAAPAHDGAAPAHEAAAPQRGRDPHPSQPAGRAEATDFAA